MDVNWTYCGDHFATYVNMESLCCLPETNMLYVTYTFKKITSAGSIKVKESKDPCSHFGHPSLFYFVICFLPFKMGKNMYLPDTGRKEILEVINVSFPFSTSMRKDGVKQLRKNRQRPLVFLYVFAIFVWLNFFSKQQ